MSVTLQAILEEFSKLLPKLIPVLFGMALVVFFWGLARFVWSTSQTGKAEGKGILLWGVVGLFVAASIWGIVTLVHELFGVEANRTPQAPEVPKYQ